MKSEDLPESGLSSPQRRALALAQNAASQVARRRFKVLRLTKNAYLKLGRHENALARVSADLRTLMRLAYAWARREYVAVPWRVILCSVAALIYFVNPVDLIPDVVVGLGFVDDAAVIAAVVRSIQTELNAFRRWDLANSTDRTATIIPLQERPAA